MLKLKPSLFLVALVASTAVLPPAPRPLACRRGRLE
jgi:hypothetical protein